MSARPRLARAALAAWVLVLTAGPRLAEACSVCTAGREEENQLAFILTTIFLSVLPLAFVGSVVFWLVRRVRALEASSAADPGTAPPAHASRATARG